jgi:hypothetical protein
MEETKEVKIDDIMHKEASIAWPIYLNKIRELASHELVRLHMIKGMCGTEAALGDKEKINTPGHLFITMLCVKALEEDMKVIVDYLEQNRMPGSLRIAILWHIICVEFKRLGTYNEKIERAADCAEENYMREFGKEISF